MKGVASTLAAARLLKLLTVAVRVLNSIRLLSYKACVGAQLMLCGVFSVWGFTWASEVWVGVVPGVLVVLEHVQASGLRKDSLYEHTGSRRQQQCSCSNIWFVCSPNLSTQEHVWCYNFKTRRRRHMQCKAAALVSTNINHRSTSLKDFNVTGNKFNWLWCLNYIQGLYR